MGEREAGRGEAASFMKINYLHFSLIYHLAPVMSHKIWNFFHIIFAPYSALGLKTFFASNTHDKKASFLIDYLRYKMLQVLIVQ